MSPQGQTFLLGLRISSAILMLAHHGDQLDPQDIAVLVRLLRECGETIAQERIPF